MTLDEAICHAEEVASRRFDDRVHCIKCADEHRQLAEWLKDYKRLKEQAPIEDAISRQAVLEINESHHGEMPNHVNHQIWEEVKALPPVTAVDEPVDEPVDAISRQKARSNDNLRIKEAL